jgi:hypothetical protein
VFLPTASVTGGEVHQERFSFRLTHPHLVVIARLDRAIQ